MNLLLSISSFSLSRHKETSHIRVLMRQEKTMKVIANHVLDHRILLAPNVGAADRSWVWTAFDFAEGTLVEKVIN
jgi:Ran-binding protein 1